MSKTTVSETQYLRQEAAKAKAEMSDALSKAKEALKQKVDPREVTRRHPWVAIGTAAVAGFTAIVVAIPSRQERELRRLERLREAMSPPAPHKPEETNGTSSHSATKPADKSSLLSVILKEVIQMIRPILLAAITASIKAGANPAHQTPQAAPDDPAHDAAGPDKSDPMK